jgi:hypothetical protein
MPVGVVVQLENDNSALRSPAALNTLKFPLGHLTSIVPSCPHGG